MTFSVNETVFIESTSLKLKCAYNTENYTGIVENILWFNEDKQIGITESTRLELLIEDIKTTDSGNYTCKVKLKNGQTFQSNGVKVTIKKRKYQYFEELLKLIYFK